METNGGRRAMEPLNPSEKADAFPKAGPSSFLLFYAEGKEDLRFGVRA
jgi:hypothetical protein